jgi:ATP-dependent DNA helicase HFM1/MER3
MKSDYAKDGPREFRKLDSLHRKVQKKSPPVSVSSITHTKPAYCYSTGGIHTLSFMESNTEPERESTPVSTDYGDLPSDGPSHFEDETGLKARNLYPSQRYDGTQIADPDTSVQDKLSGRNSEDYSDDDSLLADAMIGLADSQEIQNSSVRKKEDFHTTYDDETLDFDDDLYKLIDQNTTTNDCPQSTAKRIECTDMFGNDSISTVKASSQKNTPISSPHFNGSKQRGKSKDFVSAKNMVSNSVFQELKQSRDQVSSAMLSEKALKADKGKENSMSSATENMASKEGNEESRDMGPARDPRLKDLEPWFFAEFGDIVELVDE